MKGNDKLVESLKKKGLISSHRVEKAMLSVDRADFIPRREKLGAYVDHPLPIGDGQTISAPHMVAMMAEALDASKGQKVLEIGGGSGYHAAVVSKLIGDEGKLISIERFETLARKERMNLRRAGINNVEVVVGDGSVGYEDEAPYDRIYYTCAAPDVPDVVIKQLSEEGMILAVMGPARGTQRLVKIWMENGERKEDLITYCVFVPLVGEEGY